MIQLNKVDFYYPGSKNPVLSDFSLTIEPQSFVAIMGKNGSGKSSLTRLMNGLLVPECGSVEIDGLNTSDREANAAVKKKVGLVMSVPDNQIVAGTVEEDVAFGPENLGLPSSEIRLRVDYALELVGMSAFKTADPFSLSGGQKQRVCIAGMLAMQPRYMIFDEPVTMLDPAEQLSIMQLLKQLHQEKQLGIILITHNIQEAIIADRIIVMDQGTIAMDGNAEEVALQYEQLTDLGIEPLELSDVCRGLQNLGYDLRVGSIPDPVSLAEEICRLKSNK